MFRTEDDDFVGIPAFGEGLSYWKSVSRLLRTHWYHVTILVTEDGRSSEFTLMIDNERGLQNRLVMQNAAFAITDVQVMTPPWMNSTTKWAMERVAKISVGEDDDGFEVCMIDVDSGAVYHNSHRPGFCVNSLTNLWPVFLTTMIGAD